MKRDNGHIVGFLSLEDFAGDVCPADAGDQRAGPVRVQPIRRATGGKPEHSRLQWIVLVTALTPEGVAMTSILTGQRWEIFKEDDTLQEENVEASAALIREHLEAQGFVTAPGVYEPDRVMANIVRAGCDLWRFEDGRLLAAEAVREAGS